MSKTAIEWATHTENFFTGCDRVTAACANCYALELAPKLQRWQQARIDKGQQHKPNRYGADGDPRTSGPGFDFTVHWDKLERPSRFPAGSRVFVQSMSDTFHERAPVEALDALWAVFAGQPAVNWLVLTKRTDLMRDYLQDRDPLANVWLGVTIENRSAIHRADDLRATPAAVRYVSAEPLLGPLIAPMVETEVCEIDGRTYPAAQARGTVDRTWTELRRDWSHGDDLDLSDIDWLIAGGESGAGRDSRKLINVEADNALIERKVGWVRDLRDACLVQAAVCDVCGGYRRLDPMGGPAHHVELAATMPCPERHTAFFFKQWGGRKPKAGGRELDGRLWDELPVLCGLPRAA